MKKINRNLSAFLHKQDIWVLTSIIAAIFLLLTTNAWARAGGGEHYVGGGGDSGFGGGGGGEAEMITWLIYLAIRYPQVGVPLLLIFLASMAVKRATNPNRTTAKAIKSLEDINTGDTLDINFIKQRDPGFDEALFLTWVQKIESAIQKAWTNGDMEPVRNYQSDGMFRTFCTQLSIMKHEGRRNVVGQHQILKAKILAVEHDDHFDTIHVAIEAQSQGKDFDYSMPLEEAKQKAASVPMKKFTEVWSFLRKPGALTLNKGFNQGSCPNCGAPIENVQASKCEFCQAIVNSGDYDWVLAEITQSVEWRPSSSGDKIKGMADLRQLDPDFNRQVAEDRATYAFWRWLETTISGSKTPLAKIASESMQNQLAQDGIIANYFCAVGSVDLVECIVSDDNSARFFAKILWSSASSKKSPPIHRVNILSFYRKKLPKKDTHLSHARCAACLGPLDENDSPKCSYCGAELTAGEGSWLLERVYEQYEYQVRQSTNGESLSIPAWAVPSLASKKEREMLLFSMAAIVIADGIVTKKERRLLQTAAKRWDVPYETIVPVLSGQIPQKELSNLSPSDPTIFLDALIGAALIDGKIDSKERALLVDIALNLGISEQAVANRIKNYT